MFVQRKYSLSTYSVLINTVENDVKTTLLEPKTSN